MKTGITIQELAAELIRQNNNKRDFHVSPAKMQAYANQDELEIAFAAKDSELFAAKLTHTGHLQMGEWAGIPKPYYDRMLAHPKLLGLNLQHWMDRSSDRRLIRVLDGRIRGVLSDKYRALDNFDLANAVFPILEEAGAKIDGKTCQVTAKKLYIKALIHELVADIAIDDVVCAGILIENSEIGFGALSIKPLIMQLKCTNGNVVNKLAHKKYHVGKKRLDEDFPDIELATDTKTAEDTAYWLKVRDLTQYALSETAFELAVQDMRLSTEIKIVNPINAVEVVAKSYGFTIPEKESVLKHLVEGGSLTNWAMNNAVTRAAQDVEDFDRSIELEKVGYDLLLKNWNQKLN